MATTTATAGAGDEEEARMQILEPPQEAEVAAEGALQKDVPETQAEYRRCRKQPADQEVSLALLETTLTPYSQSSEAWYCHRFSWLQS